MARKKKRDLYGNWTWSDETSAESHPPNAEKNGTNDDGVEESHGSENAQVQNEGFGLEWRDYIALMIASLETFLLPIVIFALIILALIFVLPLFR